MAKPQPAPVAPSAPKRADGKVQALDLRAITAQFSRGYLGRQCAAPPFAPAYIFGPRRREAGDLCCDTPPGWGILVLSGLQIQTCPCLVDGLDGKDTLSNRLCVLTAPHCLVCTCPQPE